MDGIPDILEEFMKHQSELDPETTRRNRVPPGNLNYLLQNEGREQLSNKLSDLPWLRSMKGRVDRSKIFTPGTKVNFLEVVQRAGEGYLCRCIAPKKDRKGRLTGEICGREVPGITYSQLYRGAVFSCGCRMRAKHPPMRLEGSTIGRIETLRWAEEEAAWECVCTECGKILYLANAKEVRGAGASCKTHND